MNISISNQNGKPIYEQITEQIKALILAGQLKEGDPLPSMRLLAKELRISVITTKRAYEELEREGFLYTLTGKGSFVAGKNAEFLREEQLRQVGINPEVKTLESGQFQSETGNGAHDMFIMSKTSIDPDSMLRSMYHTEALGPSGNRCFWTTPEVDALIDEASTTTDTEHAMELYAEIQSKVAEAAPLVPMAVEHLNAGMQSNVKGFGLYPGKSHYINGTYFE